MVVRISGMFILSFIFTVAVAIVAMFLLNVVDKHDRLVRLALASVGQLP